MPLSAGARPGPRVLLVDETSELGGGEQNLIAISTHLAASTWKSGVVVPRPGPLSYRLRELEIPVYFCPRPPFISTSFYLHQSRKVPNPLAIPMSALAGIAWMVRLARVFKRLRPDVVHTVSLWAHALAGLTARLLGLPVIWHLQDIVGSQSGFGTYRRLLVLLARYIPDRIICVSDKVREQLGSDARILRKTTVLWNTIDPHRFDEAATRATHESKPQLTIGTAARLTPWKGQETVVQAAAILKERGVRFRWLLAGDEALGSPGYRRHLTTLIRRLGVEQQIELLGWVEDMPAFYRSIDLLVHVPIEPEPFGLVLAEAMASGLPLVASQGGGIDRLVEAGGGILVPPSQPDRLAETIMRLAEEPPELLRRGETARRYAVSNFGIEAYISQLIKVYESVRSQTSRE